MTPKLTIDTAVLKAGTDGSISPRYATIKRWVLTPKPESEEAALFRDVLATTRVNGLVTLEEYEQMKARNDADGLARVRAQSPKPSDERRPVGRTVYTLVLIGPGVKIVLPPTDGVQLRGEALSRLSEVVRQKGTFSESRADDPLAGPGPEDISY